MAIQVALKSQSAADDIQEPIRPNGPTPQERPRPRPTPRRRGGASLPRAAVIAILAIVTAAATTWLVSASPDRTPSSESLGGPGGLPSRTGRLGAPPPEIGDSAPTAALDVRPEDRPVLGYGSAGDDVAALQGLLSSLAFDPGPVDGQFGPATAAAVSAFQRSCGITADGVVGPETWVALYQRP